MRKRVLRTSLPLVVLGFALALCPPAQAQGPVPGFVFDEHGKARPVRKMPKSEIPLYNLVLAFYDNMIHLFRIGDEVLHNRLKAHIGVEPDSEAARVIMKAVFRAEALHLDTPRLPTEDREAFKEAQARQKEWLVRELRTIYVQMLRELRATGYTLERWDRFIEEEVRPGVSITDYGEQDRAYRKRLDDIYASFAKGIAEEIEGEERTP